MKKAELPCEPKLTNPAPVRLEGIVRDFVGGLEKCFKERAELLGLSTGFKPLDRITLGFSPGELVVIAGAPSMGKTAFALNVVQTMASAGKKIAYFTLESSRESVVTRMIASSARVELRGLRVAQFSANAWPKVIHAAGTLVESSVFVDDSVPMSADELTVKCRELQATEGLDCVFVDYLQLMKVTNPKMDNREREIGEVSRSLKALAKELRIPVIALSQINRKIADRTEKRPILTDLRESGSIEADADLILMLYRDDYYDKETVEKRGHAEVIVAKNRLGPTGTFKIIFEAEWGKFRDLTQDEWNSLFGKPLPPPPSVGKPKNFAPGTLP